jgi:hypothetical protein
VDAPKLNIIKKIRARIDQPKAGVLNNHCIKTSLGFLPFVVSRNA